jgi:hypothetical protein
MWWLSYCTNKCFRLKSRPIGKKKTFLPKCVFNYSINKDKAKPGKCKIITLESNKTNIICPQIYIYYSKPVVFPNIGTFFSLTVFLYKTPN